MLLTFILPKVCAYVFYFRSLPTRPKKNEAKVCIPDKSNFKIPHKIDNELYKQRNINECFFQSIKNYWHMAFRFDKLSVCFLNFVLLATAIIYF